MKTQYIYNCKMCGMLNSADSKKKSVCFKCKMFKKKSDAKRNYAKSKKS